MGSLTLPASGLVYLDTSILIYTIENVRGYLDALMPLWQASRAQQIELATSDLTVMEALTGPIKKGDAELVNAYEEVFSGTDVRLIPIDQFVLREAARVRARTSLRTPDAIHAATALLTGCAALVTNDSAFRILTHMPVYVIQDYVETR